MTDLYVISNWDLAEFMAGDFAEDTGKDIEIYEINGQYVVVRPTN
jgi:hypothetical protein